MDGDRSLAALHAAVPTPGVGSVVGEVEHDGVLRQAEPVERVEHAASRISLFFEIGVVHGSWDSARKATRAAPLAATALVRDLVNMPAADMGPAELQAHVETLGKEFDAQVTITRGDELETGYPMIHAVGQAAERTRAPRLIELEWGNPAHPRIAIIGKGVVFDTGGLNIKTGPAGLSPDGPVRNCHRAVIH